MTTIHLTAAGVSIVFDAPADALPAIVHWGAALGSDSRAEEVAATAVAAVMHSSLIDPRRFSVVPTEWEGWTGAPGVALHRSGTATTPRFRVERVTEAADAVVFDLVDPTTGVELRLDYRLDHFGVLSVSAVLTAPLAGTGAGEPGAPIDVAALRVLLPLPARADEILDQTGRWSNERLPQRTPVRDGAHRREVRRGRPGHDSPTLSVVGTAGFGFRSGEVWSLHVAWSGDQEYTVERVPEGAGVLSAALGGGELLRAGEIRLAPGESYAAPTFVFTWSDQGLDGLTDRLHGHVRAFPSHPSRPRPLVLNTWEAVYFDHDLARLTALARVAAEVGVERFVLDDGWFLGRRNDRAALGDWLVDPEVWPDGLGPIVDTVRSLGMEFGLWFEPEMINLDSELARRHPEWLLSPNSGVGPAWRHQHVLDVAHPDAYAYLLERISGLVSAYSIDYLKWDHNRDLYEAVERHPGGDRPGVHAQTTAVYALLDELLARHPDLEIESCASGGGRMDLGILRRTHRVWPSDTNDPISRQRIERWAGLLVPPELLGSHVGPRESHTTHRESTLALRLVTALFGHAGIEWDLTSLGAEELRALTAWAELYRRFRPLLHAGRVVRADLGDPAQLLRGVVGQDGSEALYAWVALDVVATAHSERIRFPGLDPERSYLVRPLEDLGPASRSQVADPPWLAAPDQPLSGFVLTTAGLPLPVLNPGHAMLFHATAA